MRHSAEMPANAVADGLSMLTTTRNACEMNLALRGHSLVALEGDREGTWFFVFEGNVCDEDMLAVPTCSFL